MKNLMATFVVVFLSVFSFSAHAHDTTFNVYLPLVGLDYSSDFNQQNDAEGFATVLGAELFYKATGSFVASAYGQTMNYGYAKEPCPVYSKNPCREQGELFGVFIGVGGPLNNGWDGYLGPILEWNTFDGYTFGGALKYSLLDALMITGSYTLYDAPAQTGNYQNTRKTYAYRAAVTVSISPFGLIHNW